MANYATWRKKRTRRYGRVLRETGMVMTDHALQRSFDRGIASDVLIAAINEAREWFAREGSLLLRETRYHCEMHGVVVVLDIPECVVITVFAAEGM